ncbi:MAG: hypothetical protein QOC77_3562 [Thermoleophilaceae bacterium]|nr:hypothetical protein [Thermoleophilaceae bacterium]
MKKILTCICAAGTVAAVTGTAVADTPSSADHQNAAKYCKALRASSGSPEAFAAAVQVVVGAKKVTVANAYGKCVSSQAKNNAKDDQQAHSNAAKDCKAEQAQSDADFAAAHGGKTFTQQYGTGKNGKNAYGRCVSQKAKANRADAAQKNKDELNAAKQCKAEKAQSDAEFSAAHGGKTFTQQYGTNKNGKNAFGKCVSSKAKEQQQQG